MICHISTLQVAGWLWGLVVSRAQLPLHLAALKSYFLLGRGDFWQGFLLEVGSPLDSIYCRKQYMKQPAGSAQAGALIKYLESNVEQWQGIARLLLSRAYCDMEECLHFLQARQVLQLPPRLSTVDSDLATALQQAAMQSGLESDPLFGTVGLRFVVPNASESPAPADTVSGPGVCHFSVCLRGPACRGKETHPGRLQAGKSKQRLHVPSLDQWDGLQLEYKLQWPLHIILTPEVCCWWACQKVHLQHEPVTIYDHWTASKTSACFCR